MQQAIEDAMGEAMLATSSSQVATSLQEHVGDRAQKRKEAIALGIKAAADREKYAAIMRSNIRTTGISDVASRSGVATVDGMGPAASGSGAPLAPPETPSWVSKLTNGTLAALDVSLKRQGRNRTAAIAGAAVAVALGLAGVVSLVTRDLPRHAAAKSTGVDPALGESPIRTIPVEELPAAPPTAPHEVSAPVPAAHASGAAPDRTGPPAPVAVPAVATAAQARPTPRPLPAKPAITSRKRIDDGF
jgi:hypothetical protein